MSVLKQKRTTSKAEFINTANQIYVETINFLTRLSARYSRLIAEPIAKLAGEIIDHAEKANSIFPSDQQRVSLRKAHLLEARASLMALDVRLTHVYLILNQNPEGAFTTSKGNAVKSQDAMEKLDKIADSDSLVIIATGKYIGEGFDYPRLDTLFLALPISWKGNIAQYAGRLHRDYDGKNEVRIYDYVDIRVPLCDSMYRKRLRAYASVGYGVPKPTGGNNVSKQELIYDGQTFSEPFRQDLLAAKHSIVISCQKIKFKYTPRLLSLLRELMTNGIEVVVCIK